MNTITATVRLESISPISFSRYLPDTKTKSESWDEYEARVWRDKAHVDPASGEVFIPPMMMKFALVDGCKHAGSKIKGKGASMWHKRFSSGVMIFEPILLGVKPDKMSSEVILCHADGKRGSGVRVPRMFPFVGHWKATVETEVTDTEIPEKIFLEALEHTGKFVGLGRFSPRVGGFNGRFKVMGLDWKK